MDAELRNVYKYSFQFKNIFFQKIKITIIAALQDGLSLSLSLSLSFIEMRRELLKVKKMYPTYVLVSIMVREFANSPGDQFGSIPGRVITKTRKNGT